MRNNLNKSYSRRPENKLKLEGKHPTRQKVSENYLPLCHLPHKKEMVQKSLSFLWQGFLGKRSEEKWLTWQIFKA